MGLQGVEIKISSGKKFNIRASKALVDQFPDGCKVEVLPAEGGGFRLSLVNRVSNKFSATQKSGEYILSLYKIAGTKLPDFGAVQPEKITEIRGGLMVYLPEALPPLKAGRPTGSAKVKPAAAKAKPPAPAAPAATRPQPPATAATLPAPSPAPVAAEPQITLRDAVRAVNAWKALLGPKVQLRLEQDGTLAATAEYQ